MKQGGKRWGEGRGRVRRWGKGKKGRGRKEVDYERKGGNGERGRWEGER